MDLEVRRVWYSIDGETILEDVNMRLEGPGLVQLLGPNGAGKTTLLRVIAGLLKPTRGDVIVCGENVTGRPELAGRCIGYVPQRPPISRYNPMTVGDFLATRMLLGGKWPRIRPTGSLLRHARGIMEIVGVDPRLQDRRLWELSGGQLMRVFIARTLLHEPEILLLDEPLAPVDPSGKAEIAKLLADLARDKLVIVTSHDPILLMEHTRTLILLNRRIHGIGAPSEIFRQEVLARVYGGAVVEVGRHIHIVDEHGGGRS
ncbi:MAG: metal ABC transporter ATP-binding protein [Desulfurococcales archaeon]|nr:metal ABC transporter ATP-binding protein [Desulfurococcales archaeon]